MVDTHLLLLMTGVSWHVLYCCLMMLQTPVVHSTPLWVLVQYMWKESICPSFSCCHTKPSSIAETHLWWYSMLRLRLLYQSTISFCHLSFLWGQLETLMSFNSCSKILWSSCVKPWEKRLCTWKEWCPVFTDFCWIFVPNSLLYLHSSIILSGNSVASRIFF